MPKISGEYTGRRYRTLVQDMEEDDDFGEVLHPVGSEFTVGEFLGEGIGYVVLWHHAVDAQGTPVPPKGCEGMWTIWEVAEINKDAELLLEVTQ